MRQWVWRALGQCGVALLATSAPHAIAGAQAFEGVISMRITPGARGGQSATMDAQYMTKQGDVRVEVGAGTPNSMAGIILPGEKKMYRLMSSQSLYTEQPLPDLSAPSATPAPHVVRTGRKETIAGYQCEHVMVVAAPDTADLCMAKGLGTFATAAAALGAAGARMAAWQRGLLTDGAFPLRITQRGATLMEVTKVEKKFLPGTLFVVPDNYSLAPAQIRKPG